MLKNKKQLILIFIAILLIVGLTIIIAKITYPKIIKKTEAAKTTSIYAVYKDKDYHEGMYLDMEDITVYKVLNNGQVDLENGWICDNIDNKMKVGTNVYNITCDSLETTISVYANPLSTYDYAPSLINYDINVAKAKAAISDIDNLKLTFDDAFLDALFVGDSIMRALASYRLINEDRVVAKVGVGLAHLDENYEAIVKKAPKTIILHYGINSISVNDEAKAEFFSMYRGLIERLKTDLPNTRIVITDVFPVAYSQYSSNIKFTMIDEYNLKLVQMCNELDVEFFSAGYYLKEHSELYSGDGLHLLSEFYTQYWLRALISEAGIGL